MGRKEKKMGVAVDVSQIEGVHTKPVWTTTYTATISSSGQVTLPAAVREKIGVGKNEKVEFEVGEQIVVKKPQTWDEFFEDQRKWLEAEKKRRPEFAKALKENAGKTADELRKEWDETPEGWTYYKEKYGV